MKTKYRVTGPYTVNGVAPGDIVELGEDSPLNIPALIEAGHLTAFARGGLVQAPGKKGGS